MNSPSGVEGDGARFRGIDIIPGISGMRFLKRGAAVEAERWFGPGGHPRVVLRTDGWAVATPEGWREVKSGDWILTDETGNSWPMSDTQFKSLYAPA
jgi:hypothetical protein